MNKSRSLRTKLFSTLGAFSLLGALHCGVEFDLPPDDVRAPADAPPVAVGDEKADSSLIATILDFDFTGELVAPSWGTRDSWIKEQFLYTIGHLNGNNSVGRMDRLALSNIQATSLADGKVRITYRAKFPVAWGSKTNLPTSYEFTLPKDVSAESLEAFTTSYKATCVDYAAHDVDSGSMWYYFRPKRSGCSLAAADVVKFTATVALSSVNTTGKYPEYNKVWEDGVLKVVTIFGKNEDGATTASDPGVAAFNTYVKSVKTTLQPYALTTTPASVSDTPGIENPDVTLRATLATGKTVEVVALLVDNVRTAGAAFDARYEQLSTRADLIAYNGHAGLGQNVRALARKGKWTAGQYLIVYMGGCDTYAYVDGYLADARAALNPDDPSGTKYLDFLVNAMPAYFNKNPTNSLALLRGLMKFDAPVTFETIMNDFDPAQVVLVTGEQDNVYTPGGGSGGGGGGAVILEQTGAVAKNVEARYQTGTLEAGGYVVTLSPNPATASGDADLYVKRGSAPTTSAYDCRPYKSGSSEECAVTLASAASIHVMVRGYSSSASAYRVTLRRAGATPPSTWAGIDESGTVARNQEKRWQTPVLPAGSYVFETTGTGDADLYVKAGSAPTTSSWTCRPYRSGSNETCELTLSSAGVIHAMVRGYAATSTFRLVGRRK
jgi:hypothetical protein